MSALTIDLDALADSLGVSVRTLKARLQDLALASLASEAGRVAHGEAWAGPSDRLLTYQVEHRHVVAAAQSLLAR